jgi:molecular chaperone Hsp33
VFEYRNIGGEFMSDKITRFMSHVDMASIVCADTTELVERARQTHGLNPTPTAALGRTLTMSVMMGVLMKGDNDKLTIQILGDGPLGSILTVANNKGIVKGYVGNPMAEADITTEGKLNVKGIVGKGQLNVIRDIGFGEPYIGNVPLQTGEIAEDFAYYYAKSEQTPTAVALGVLVNKDGSVKKAGGYMIQILPDTPEEIIKLIENRIASSKPITEMLDEGMTLEEIATYISDDLNTRIVDEDVVPKYECNCSRQKMEKAIISMGKKEIMELAEDDETEIQCQFCNKKYIFSKDEIVKLIKSE